MKLTMQEQIVLGAGINALKDLTGLCLAHAADRYMSDDAISLIMVASMAGQQAIAMLSTKLNEIPEMPDEFKRALGT